MNNEIAKPTTIKLNGMFNAVSFIIMLPNAIVLMINGSSKKPGSKVWARKSTILIQTVLARINVRKLLCIVRNRSKFPANDTESVIINKNAIK